MTKGTEPTPDAYPHSLEFNGRRRCWCGVKHPAPFLYWIRSRLPGYWKPVTSPLAIADLYFDLRDREAARNA